MSRTQSQDTDTDPTQQTLSPETSADESWHTRPSREQSRGGGHRGGSRGAGTSEQSDEDGQHQNTPHGKPQGR